MNFSDIKFIRDKLNGISGKTHFANGYSASVIRNDMSYGGKLGLYEIAVLYKGEIVYDTPITADVIGYVPEDLVELILKQIEALSPRESS